MMFMKKNGGFTLVELIVVIAILAILAGVAVPAYSGYVEKANAAADESLLASVNTAFAAACAFNGEDHSGRSDAKANIVDNDVVLATSVDAINASFDEFFEGGQFEMFTALSYNSGTGMFEEGVILKYGNTTIVVSRAVKDKVLASTWGDVESGQILTLVDGTLAYVSNYNKDYLAVVTESEDFKDIVSATLGTDYSTYMNAYVDAKAKEEYEKTNGVGSWDELKGVQKTNYIKQNGLNEKYQNEANSNMAILVAAQNVQAQKDAVMNVLTNDPSQVEAMIKGNLTTGENGDPVAGLSQAALAYGLYSSYMVSQGTDPSTIQPGQAWVAFEDDSFNAGFKEYLRSPQGQTDLEGVLAAMDTIGGQDSAVADSIVQNGVTDQVFADALKDIWGK